MPRESLPGQQEPRPTCWTLARRFDKTGVLNVTLAF